MAQDYKIKDVKKNEVWSNDYGQFQSYALSLEGVGEPVSLNRKIPIKEEPVIGSTIYGSLELMTSKSGRTYYKFKTEKKDEPTYQKVEQNDEYWQERNDSIKAQFAIKAAVELLKNPEADIAEDTIEHWAKKFFDMVDRVATDRPASSSDEDSAPQYNNKRIEDEPINLDDIPF